MARNIIINADTLENLPAKERQLYLHLCAVAAWSERHKVWGVNVMRGQYLTTVRTLAADMMWPQTVLYRHLRKLAGRGVLCVERVKVIGRVNPFAILVSLKTGGMTDTLCGTTNGATNNLNTNDLHAFAKQRRNNGGTTSGTTSGTTNCLIANIPEGSIGTTAEQRAEHTPNIQTTNNGGGNTRARASEAARIEAEMAELLGDDMTCYMIAQKSGGAGECEMLAHLHEFAVEQTLKREEGVEAEHGLRLAMHYGFWLAHKLRAVKKQDKASPPAPTATLERAYELITNQKLR